MRNNALENSLRDSFRYHGFPNAAELFDFRGFSNNAISRMIDSWKKYPGCMDVYPKILSPKTYVEE